MTGDCQIPSSAAKHRHCKEIGFMDFDLQIAYSVEEIGQEAWDRLSGGRPFASYRWYRYGETVLADSTPIYIILSRCGEPVARGTFWLRRQEQLPISSRIARRLIEALLHRWPLLLCRVPLADSSGLILPEEPLLRDAALETIAWVAQDQAQRHRVSFLACDYLEKHEIRYPGWPDVFAAVKVPEPGTRLVITWPDFESYLGYLSKSMRKDYRRHRNRAADLGIEVKRHPMTQSLDETTLDQAVVLIRNVERHHKSAPNPWARAMLKNAYMVHATWLTAETGDRMVGCGLLLGNRHQEMKLLGLDYEMRYAYFQVVYAAIRCAIEQGAQVLWGGSGAYELKQRLGFQLESNHHAVFASRGPLLQRLGRWVATMEGNGHAETRGA